MAVMVLVIRNVHTRWVEYPDRHLQALVESLAYFQCTYTMFHRLPGPEGELVKCLKIPFCP